MGERFLPPEILQRATLRGNEYAWSLKDVPDVIAAARSCGLATLGGNIQFRIPEGTCDLYWLTVESSSRSEGEAWPTYVVRSAEEVLVQLERVQAHSDFTTEARNFEILAAKQASGENLNEFLCLVLYFNTELPSS